MVKRNSVESFIGGTIASGLRVWISKMGGGGAYELYYVVSESGTIKPGR